LVLGAGGVVGHAYHVGVLSALADDLGWDASAADLIVGTSAGSVVGASLRAGLHPSDMRCRALREPLSSKGAALVCRADAAIAAATAAVASHPSGAEGDGDGDGVPSAFGMMGRRWRIASPQRVRRALREPWRVTPGSLLSAVLPAGRQSTVHLRAPYDEILGRTWPKRDLWIVAVDLDLGPRVVFGRDGTPPVTVGQAVEASCAIPGYFAPVAIDAVRYVDGGVHSTTNADLVADRDPRPDLVVVSAPMSAVRGAVPRSQRLSIRQLVRRQLAGEVAALRAKGLEVVTFQPTAEDVAAMSGDSMDPAKGSTVCAQAVQSTRAHLAEGDIGERLAPLITARR
jgi:NTE family protein